MAKKERREVERIIIELEPAFVAAIEDARRQTKGSVPSRSEVMRDLLAEALKARGVKLAIAA